MPRKKSPGRVETLVFNNRSRQRSRERLPSLSRLVITERAPAQVKQRRRSRSRRRASPGPSGPRMSAAMGSAHFHQKEPISQVTIPAGTAVTATKNFEIAISASCPAPQLKAVGAVFSRVRFNSLTVEYVPYASAMTSGRVIIAFDQYATRGHSNVTYDQVAGFGLSKSGPVHSPMKLVLSRGQLMNKEWYRADSTDGSGEDDRAGNVWYGVSAAADASKATVYGHLYFTYDVDFSGARTPE